MSERKMGQDILRTRPPADRARRPLQSDQSRSVVLAAERIGRQRCYRVGAEKSMWTNVNFAFFHVIRSRFSDN
jgi:hypothetical protein